MNWKRFRINGQAFPMEVTITGEGAPGPEIDANPGQLYMDTQTGDFYKCTSSDGETSVWDTLGGVPFDEVYADQDTGYLHIRLEGEDVVDPCYIGNIGGGGGGSGNNAVLTVTNQTGWYTKTLNLGADCVLVFEWSSIEAEQETGDGVLTVKVNGNIRRTMDIRQGVVRLNIGEYLTAGTNKIRLSVADVYENTKSVNFTIQAAELKLTSKFDHKQFFTADQAIPFTYTPYGSMEKTVILLLDGEEAGRQTVTTSGRQQTFSLPAMAHGAHRLVVYYTAMIEGDAVESNRLDYELMVVDSTADAPIIASDYRRETAVQFETLSIPYRVYTPGSLTSKVGLYRGEEKTAEVTVDRGDQVWSFKENEAGQHTYTIRSGSAALSFAVNAAESDIDAEAEEDALALALLCSGRSNAEEHPEIWEDEEREISCSLTGFNFVSNGWVRDGDGLTALRVSGGARVTIPYQPFARDFRGTGKTIEFEFASRNILDYDAPLVSCMSGGRGFLLTSQRATLSSEQTSISTQYKEDEHVRISFVCEKRTEDRLLSVYINGIMSGVVQYPDDDDFSQQTPASITIGSDSCTTDLYCIRIYDNNLTRFQIVNNWIADTGDVGAMAARFERNNVYDEYGKIVIEKLPSDLPYMILEAPELPQYKGDKKTVTGSYTDPVRPERSFTFTGCQANVQGTSSAPYARKNYDLQFKAGFETAGGRHADNYELEDGIIPFNRFVLKADVASSEGANNVELVKLFIDANPYTTRERQADPRVRSGIYGFPIVVFWHNTEDGSVTLLGKYNFNLPKRAPEPYGYSGDMESWEFQNNTSDLMLFLSDTFSEAPKTDPETGETKAEWRYDYEARFPSDEWVDYSKLQEFQSFVFSTRREGATGEDLETPVTYTETHVVYDETVDPETGAVSYRERLVTEDVTYAKDTAEYRLSRFHHEFGKYAEVDSFIFYYIFTELFLMVDSRAKNLFIGFSGSDTDPAVCKKMDRKAVAEPYDMDTAIGTNNEGSLVFGYSLEDTDHTEGGADVFNGQNSVLWCNLRDAFQREIAQMYQTLRSRGTLSFATVEQRFEEHQAKWSEAIFNDDAQFKYLDPLVNPDPGKEPTAVYLPMLQGSKAEQRKWWLYNRFRYMDSKWNAGDALRDAIQLRGYAKADITVTPYADIYPTVKYGSYPVSVRGRHGVPTTLVCPLDNVNDTEIYIYSASQIASVGDLSGLKVGFADFSKATRLQSIKVGSGDAGYTNGNLTGLDIGTNSHLGTVDARNCTALAGTVDFSGAESLEHVYLEGTAVTSCSLPTGGILKTLHLPGTVTNLTIRNQTGITDFSMGGYSSISTLRIEKTAGIPISDILLGAESVNRVRITDTEWECDTAAHFETILARLKAAHGLDESGNNTETAVVSGVVRVTESVSAETLADCAENFPDLLVVANGSASCTVRFRNADGTLLYTETVPYGGNAPDPVATGAIEVPVQEGSGRVAYVYAGWDTPLTNITGHTTVRATYTTSVAVVVTFRNWDGTILHTAYVAEGGNAYDPVTSGLIQKPARPATSEAAYTFIGWAQSLYNVTTDRDIFARYAEQESVTVTFENYGGVVLYTAYIASGASAPDPVQAGFIPTPTREPDATYLYTFNGWNKTFANLTADTTVTATYTSVQYYTATFNDADGNLLYTERVVKNGRVLDPVTEGWIETPTKTPEPTYNYIYKGWNAAMSTNMTANVTYTAQFKTDRSFTVLFVDYDGTTVLDTQMVLDEEAALDPVTSGRIPTPIRMPTAQYEYTWKGWNKTFAKITGDTTVTATYTRTTRSYTVRFYDGEVLLDTVTVLYNGTANPSSEPQKSGVSDPENWIFNGWSPTNTSIQGDTDCYVNWEQATITDTWAQIFAAEADGSYSTKYAVGDTKFFVLGETETVVMQIVAFDADTLEEGGKAKITWLSKYLLKDNHRMNPSKSGSTEGTGAIGGWEKCEMRSYLRETIKPMIPEAIRNQIQNVKKYSKIYNTSSAAVNNVESVDDVWIPSMYEMGFSQETTGVQYNAFFDTNAKKAKRKLNASAASGWWLRSAANGSNFNITTMSASYGTSSANNSYDVALGFCT